MSEYRTAAEEDADSRGVSVIVPTYNERANVVGMVRACRRALAGYETEVIVVDDDSPDRTWAVVDRTFADDEGVRVVRRTEDTGLATAVVDGFGAADREVLAVIDADFQHPPDRLPDLVDALEETAADVAVASRYLSASEIEGWSRRRRLISRVATATAQAMVPEARELSDPLSGFFAVRRGVVDGAGLSPTGYKILLELLTECRVDRVTEVPFTFSGRDRGASKAGVGVYSKFLEHLASCSYRTRIESDETAAANVPLSAVLKR